MPMPKTAAIVLNWNGLSSSRKAIASLQQSTAAPSIVVVDNGSRENEAAQLRAEFPNVTVIALQENVGFARGVNAGALAALHRGANNLLLFNNDAWMTQDDDVISRLEALLENDGTIGAAGPTICNPDGSVQSCGYNYSLWFPVPRARRIAKGQRTVRGMFLSGSCLLVRGSLFAQIGGLDPDLFMYGDDVDLTIRIRKLGFTTALIEGTVLHERGATIGLASSRYIYSVLRGNLIVVLKHATPAQRPSAFGTLVAASIGLCLLGLRRRNAGAPAAALKAWLDFLSKRWGGFDGVRLGPAIRPSAFDYAGAVQLGERVGAST